MTPQLSCDVKLWSRSSVHYIIVLSTLKVFEFLKFGLVCPAYPCSENKFSIIIGLFTTDSTRGIRGKYQSVAVYLCMLFFCP